VDQEIKYIIVEDQDIVSLGLKVSLEEFGKLHLVGLAKDGEEAIEMALALKPDLIIMDLGLPRLDGIEATRKICLALPQIKVLIMSSREKARDIFACFAAGASGYCRKEASASEVFAAMQAMINGELIIEATIAGRILACWREIESSTSLSIKNSAPFSFSEMELQIISLTADGLNNSAMAAKLGLSADALGQQMQILKQSLARLGTLLVNENETS
jgi:NarL family two-component system response regulator LiaR